MKMTLTVTKPSKSFWSISYLCSGWSWHFKFNIQINSGEYERRMQDTAKRGHITRPLSILQNTRQHPQNGAKETPSYNERLTGNYTQPVEWHRYKWPWVTLKVILAVWDISKRYISENVGLSRIRLAMKSSHANWKVHRCWMTFLGNRQLPTFQSGWASC